MKFSEVPFNLITAKTDEEYRKLLKRRIITAVLVGIIGIVVAVAFTVYKPVAKSSLAPYARYYAALGIGLAAYPVAVIPRWIRLIKNGKNLHREFIEATDERNQENCVKALKTTLSIIKYTAVAAMCVLIPFNMTIALTIAYVIIVFSLIYLISYAIISKIS